MFLMLSSTLSLVTFFGFSSALAVTRRDENPGYYYIPLEFDYGANNRVTANFTFGSVDEEPIQTVIDTGSANSWASSLSVHPSISILTIYPDTVTKRKPPLRKPTPYNVNLSSTGVSYDHGSAYAYDTLSSPGSTSPIPNIQFALENYGILRQVNDGTCSIPEYDKAILGLSTYTNTTTGPSFRQNLFDAGLVATKTLSMWFEYSSNSFLDTFSGGVIFGGLDTSKFSGPLVEVENIVGQYQIGVYVAKPDITINDITFVPDQDVNCLIDSGAHADTLPFSYLSNITADFLAASGGVLTEYAGVIGFNGSCSDIPEDLNITYTFAGKNDGEKVEVAVPVRNYARGAASPYSEPGLCLFNLETGGCLFGATFLTAAFLGMDDGGNGSVWLAQGLLAQRLVYRVRV